MTKFTRNILFKSIVLSLVAVLFLSAISPSLTHASSTDLTGFKTEGSNIEAKKDELSLFTKEDILSLVKYVSVDDNGYFKLNEKKAIIDGVPIKLLEGQRNDFNKVNSDIQKELLKANKNLEIGIKNPTFTIFGPSLEEQNHSTLSSCNGVTTSPKTYWWEQSRELNSCDANRFSANMYSLAAGYFSLFEARVNTHNSTGRGVKPNVTWGLAFSVSSQ